MGVIGLLLRQGLERDSPSGSLTSDVGCRLSISLTEYRRGDVGAADSWVLTVRAVRCDDAAETGDFEGDRERSPSVFEFRTETGEMDRARSAVDDADGAGERDGLLGADGAGDAERCRSGDDGANRELRWPACSLAGMTAAGAFDMVTVLPVDGDRHELVCDGSADLGLVAGDATSVGSAETCDRAGSETPATRVVGGRFVGFTAMFGDSWLPSGT